MPCLEPAPELARRAVHNMARSSRVQVRTAPFELAILEPERFDLMLAATSWHWIDPVLRYEKAARVLRPAGMVAILINAHPMPLVGVFARVQDI